VVDRERVLAKLDEMDGYLAELQSIMPADLDEYRRVEKRRACERLVQVSVECVLDVCHLMVAGLRLGLPGEEDDVFEKLEAAGVVSTPTYATLRRMKGCRNILVHEYGHVLDELVFETVSTRLGDFAEFKRQVLTAMPRD
jgi:uncharacterized protein YutE (UPF0331/DUF86 family)